MMEVFVRVIDLFVFLAARRHGVDRRSTSLTTMRSSIDFSEPTMHSCYK
jgi:hypothetical protein